jgi:hypothetical protein
MMVNVVSRSRRSHFGDNGNSRDATVAAGLDL